MRSQSNGENMDERSTESDDYDAFTRFFFVPRTVTFLFLGMSSLSFPFAPLVVMVRVK